jgi:para-aminobenzoate synthetase/4-amino-4-deoxychorismate lyase
MRLALHKDGTVQITAAVLTPLKESSVGVLLGPDHAFFATDAGDPLLHHKTTRRADYDRGWREAEAKGAFDTLFFNERGELTEGGRSNVFVRINGHWYTPPLSCGVLPGVLRAVMLGAPAWKASERVITRNMLEGADDIVVCNSLRGPLRAVLDTMR